MASEDAIAELAASLFAEDVPIKLRCATCSLIAYNALRLPCCEQNICEPCFNELEEVCQVCHHEPLDKSLCTANKSLRTTTKVFLKKKLLEKSSEAKKRDGLATATAAVRAPADASGSDKIAEIVTTVSNTTEGQDIVDQAGSKAVPDPSSTKPSTASVNPSNIRTGQLYEEQQARESTRGEIAPQDAGLGEDASRMQEEPWSASGAAMSLNQGNENNQIQDMNHIGGFTPAMASMMAMGAMPNMLGMGMDPMMNAMAGSMFGGFGGPHMVMNGMNMGMGQGQFSGPWMMNQDTYNANAQGDGGFGNHAGYNMLTHQGNFSQMNHQQYHRNDYNNGFGRQGYHFRGNRGRRGGFYGPQGRYQQGYMNRDNSAYHGDAAPAYHQDQSQQQHNEMMAQQHANEAVDKPDNKQDDALLAANGDAAAHGVSMKDEHAEADPPHNAETEGGVGQSKKNEEDVDMALSNVHNENDAAVEGQPLPIQTFISEEPRVRNPLHLRSNGSTGTSSQYPEGPCSSFNPAFPTEFSRPGSVTTPRVIGVPGAPTGPKALREGFKNANKPGFALQRPTISSGPSGPQDPGVSFSSDKRPSHSRSPSRPRSGSPKQRSSLGKEARFDGDADNDRPINQPLSERYDEEKDVYDTQATEASHHDYERTEIRRRRDSHQSPRREHPIRGDSDYYRNDRKDRSPRSKERRYGNERESDHGERYGRDYKSEKSPGVGQSEDDEARRRRSRSHSPVDTRSRGYYDREDLPDRTSRKRRDRDESREDDCRHERDRHRDREHNKDRHSRRHRKRSRRDRSRSHSPSGRRHAGSSHGESNINTPITPNFPTSSRSESFTNPIPTGPSIQAIPSGPRAHDERRRGGGSHRGNRRMSRSEALDAERDDGGSAKGNVPEKDPHTLEREARDRERLMKEMQRRAVFDETRNGEGKRKSSVKYEDNNRDSTRRAERDRERQRRRR